jgi:hypothetical protein
MPLEGVRDVSAFPHRGLTALTFVGLFSCGDGNSYEAAESGLRAWITAVRGGDGTACDLMTAEYRREFTSENGGDDTNCERVIESRPADVLKRLPPDDVQMEIPVWDPSGEAQVETTDGQRVKSFWMQYQDGRWLVAGTAT